MFNRRFSVSRGRFFASHGSPLKIVYDPIVLEDGTIQLKPSGEINTDERIEAQRMSTDISVIISKFIAGDSSVLNRYTPVYADVSNNPKTLAENLQRMIDVENAFSALPVDVKRKFGSDWRVWLASAGSDEWIKNMSPVVPEAVKAAASIPGEAPASAAPSSVEMSEQSG